MVFDFSLVKLHQYMHVVEGGGGNLSMFTSTPNWAASSSSHGSFPLPFSTVLLAINHKRTTVRQLSNRHRHQMKRMHATDILPMKLVWESE